MTPLRQQLANLLLLRPGEGRMLAYLAGFNPVLGLGMALGRGSSDALFFKRFGVEYLPHMLFLTSLLLMLVPRVAVEARLAAFGVVLAGVYLWSKLRKNPLYGETLFEMLQQQVFTGCAAPLEGERAADPTGDRGHQAFGAGQLRRRDGAGAGGCGCFASGAGCGHATTARAEDPAQHRSATVHVFQDWEALTPG